MKLFLTSAGLPPETTEEFLKILPKNPEELELCFIATAADPEENKWFVEKDKKRLLELGFKIKEIDLKQENTHSLRIKLKGVDVIFVEGGNTFYLLKYVRKSGFDKVLKPFLDRGGIYLGVSAGTYIAGLDISPTQWKHAEDKNIVGLKDLRGLCLIDFAIFSHYKPKHESIIKENKHKIPSTIVALTDKQAVLVNGKDYKIVGSGKKHIFNTSEKFNL